MSVLITEDSGCRSRLENLMAQARYCAHQVLVVAFGPVRHDNGQSP